MSRTNESSYFGITEGVRILLPGFYCVMLIWLFSVVLFDVDLFSTGSSASLLLIVVSGSLAGLLLYATEGSKRRKAFLENQPSGHLLELSRSLNVSPPLDDNDAQRLYFYILNSYMPATFHQRIFIFGTIYHVLTTIRRITLFFGLTGCAAIGTFLLFRYYDRITIALIVITISLLFIYFINARYNKADRKMQENYQDQIYWLTMHRNLLLNLIRHREAPETIESKEI